MNTTELEAEERRWRESAGRALRASEQDLDALTVARLRAMRTRAVAAAAEARAPLNWALPLAVAAGLLAWTWLPRFALVTEPAPPVSVAAVETFELLTDEQDPEFYENLELYQWLEEDAGGNA